MVKFGSAIDLHDDTIIFLSTATKVTHLEVESTLVEPIPIREIVHRVHDVKSVYDRCIRVGD